jgi:hypothetical protein
MAKAPPNKQSQIRYRGIRHEAQKHVIILEDTQVWGESWEQDVVDATLWRTAPAVV